MRKISKQILGGTRRDSQGEKLSKEFLQSYCDRVNEAGGRILLHQHHDMLKQTAGYIENVRLVPDHENDGEWSVIGDVFVEEERMKDFIGGFSISGVEMIRESQRPTALIYIPYPHYNDSSFIEALCSDSELSVGKWIKKGDDPSGWVILGSTIAFVLTPVWDEIYKTKISPRISELLTKYSPLFKAKGLSAELNQIVIFQDQEVEIRLIPIKGKEAICLESTCIRDGLLLAMDFLRTDTKATEVGINRVVAFYDERVSSYVLHRVEYGDGSVEHFA